MAPRWNPATAAVLVVDVQNDFCHPQGSLTLAGRGLCGVEPMTARLSAFLTRARAAGMPVVFVRTTHDERSDTPQWVGRRDRRPSGGPPEILVCRTGTWGSGFYQVAPEPADVVLTKHRYSAFAGTKLDQELRARNISSLLFTGVATEVCVETSLREAVCRDFDATLVSDCCAGFSEEAHTHCAATLARHFAVVACAEEIEATWVPSNVR